MPAISITGEIIIKPGGGSTIITPSTDTSTIILYLAGLEYTLESNKQKYYHYYTTNDFYKGVFIDQEGGEHFLYERPTTTTTTITEYRLINSENQKYIVCYKPWNKEDVMSSMYGGTPAIDEHSNICYQYQYSYNLQSKDIPASGSSSNTKEIQFFRLAAQGPFNSDLNIRLFRRLKTDGAIKTYNLVPSAVQINTQGQYDKKDGYYLNISFSVLSSYTPDTQIIIEITQYKNELINGDDIYAVQIPKN